MISNKKKLIINEIVENHLNAPEGSRGIVDKSFWEEALSIFPEFSYNNVAFRAIACSKESLNVEDLKSCGTSWSFSLEGIRVFVEEGHNISTPYIVIKSKIFGFNIHGVCNFILKNKDFFQELEIGRATVYMDEEEIVLIEKNDNYEIFKEVDNPSLYFSQDEADKRDGINEISKKLYKGIPGLKKP